MYIPDIYKNENKEEIIDFLQKNSFGILVNYGHATGQEILNVSKNIQETIFNIFGIHIEAEVNVI